MASSQTPDEIEAAPFGLGQSSFAANARQEQDLGLHKEPTLSPELEQLHTQSLLQYPSLPISAGEYVIHALRRNTVGLLAIWAVVGLLMVITLAILPLYALNIDGVAAAFSTAASRLPSPLLLVVPLLLIELLFVLGGVAASWVYTENRLYLTNESIIEYVQDGLFNSRLRQINLTNVEDVSSHQRGIPQQIFNYGDIRISTKGYRTIYHFTFVNNPDRIVKIINDAVENATGNAARFWNRGPDTEST